MLKAVDRKEIGVISTETVGEVLDTVKTDDRWSISVLLRMALLQRVRKPAQGGCDKQKGY